MLRIFMVAALVMISATTYAESTGGISCPNGKIEAKSFGAYFVPEKGNYGMVFFKEALTEDEMDYEMASRTKMFLKRDPKGPTGKRGKYQPMVFKITGMASKGAKTVSAAELAKSYTSFHYICDKTEALVDIPSKEREAKVKAFIQNLSVDLKQGGKVDLNTNGDYAGVPNDKYKVKVGWKIQGTTKLRVYE